MVGVVVVVAIDGNVGDALAFAERVGVVGILGEVRGGVVVVGEMVRGVGGWRHLVGRVVV